MECTCIPRQRVCTLLRGFSSSDELAYARYGKRAITRVYEDVIKMQAPMPGVTDPEAPPGYSCWHDFMRKELENVGIDLPKYRMGQCQIPRNIEKVDLFLNRILGLPLHVQSAFFEHFFQTYEATITVAKSEGKYDDGIVELRAESIKMKPNYPQQIYRCPESGTTTNLAILRVDKGVTFDSAKAKLAEHRALGARAQGALPDVRHSDADSGFWIGRRKYFNTGYPLIVLAVETARRYQAGQHYGHRRWFRIIRPNNGDAVSMDYENLEIKYKRLDDEARTEHVWNFWMALCEKQKVGTAVKRIEFVTLVTGAVLPVWNLIEQAHQQHIKESGDEGVSVRKVRIVRAELSDAPRTIGLQIDPQSTASLRRMLTQYTEEQDEMKAVTIKDPANL
ncbi:hypothetical protein CYMTET_5250 [Cymbomonas tetramitiformis]|uniref:Strawberry notch helicase C domain-containing protein n=1 Tax=Cymbomonas tetramitiformis TaxID=36881 RepID=A0AAE0GZS5_9CHLO|nr:hypothetical protein CYMTET_5250 [Cymbomonas tetramitiformis]